MAKSNSLANLRSALMNTELARGIEPVTRVLLAEDDPALRGLIAEDLRELGYEVVEVQNGYELLDALARYGLNNEGGQELDAVITDVRMPGPWGTTALGSFRLYDWYTPLIVMSAFADEHVAEECERTGARLLVKPFHHEALIELLDELVSPRPGPGA